MKAFICEKYGPPNVLKLKEVNKPIPKENEVLIKVHTTTVNAADCNARGLSFIPTGLKLIAKLMMGFKKPKKKILGSVLAGEIEAIGKDIKSFKIGDKVYGTSDQLGAYAEYACRTEESTLIKIPDNISFEEAASIPYGALTALYFLQNMAEIKSSQKVLIKGASGGVGVYAVQLAKYFGAEVTGVCSTRNIEFVRSLGADKVIDYSKEDFTRANEKWDVILDIVVKNTSFSKHKKSLNTNGYYLAIAGGLNDMLQMMWTSIKGGKKVMFGGGNNCGNFENFNFINELIEKRELKPVIDKSFSFQQMIEAHQHVEGGSKRGNITIKVLH